MCSQIISSSSQTPKMAILPSEDYCLMTIFLPCPEVVIISNTHCTCNPSNTFIPIWLLQNTSVAHGGFWLSEAHPRLFAFLFFVWLHPVPDASDSAAPLADYSSFLFLRLPTVLQHCIICMWNRIGRICLPLPLIYARRWVCKSEIWLTMCLRTFKRLVQCIPVIMPSDMVPNRI